MDLAALRTSEATALMERATKLLEADPGRAAPALRRHTDDAALATAALGQVQLRRAAVGKFGDDARAMFFSREGLEQASRAAVARRRAERLAASGAGAVADLCCGIGSDALALARKGLRVLAVDRDPAAVGLARANAEVLGLAELIEVREADALGVDLSDVDAVFADPARRVNGRRVYDPARYTPPLPELWRAAARVPRRVAKVGPGIDHAAIPADTEAEWVSVDGDVVEAALWNGFDDAVARRATLLRGADAHQLTGSGEREAPVGEVGEFLYEPDGAVIRAHLVAELSDLLGARLAHPTIAYLYADARVNTPFARGLRVLDVLPFHVKKLAETLRHKRIGRLTIKKRGADVVPERLRAKLRLAGDNEATLVITRHADRHVALLCEGPETPRR